MGHKGTMESRYTTNKGILPVILINEMSDASARSEEYLDQTNMIPRLDQKIRIQEIIDQATPEQLNHILIIVEHILKTGLGKPAI